MLQGAENDNDEGNRPTNRENKVKIIKTILYDHDDDENDKDVEDIFTIDGG